MTDRELSRPPDVGSRGVPLVARREQLSRLAPLAVLVVLFVIGSIVVNGFTSSANVSSILVLGTFLGVAAAGQTLVVIVGGIDLSIAATIGFGEVAMTVLYGQGYAVWEVLLLLAGCAVVIGVVNGGLVSMFRVPPLIVSLGVGFMVEGAVLIWTSGGLAQGKTPSEFARMASVASTIGPIPIPPVVLIWLGLGAVVLVIQRFTTFGRQLYALGSNPEAAHFALVPRNQVWIAAYVTSAAAGLLAGVLLSGFAGGADFAVGTPYLFNSIAAVVVGGTLLLGGSGGYGRTVIGSLVVIEIGTILVGLGFDSALQETMLGVFIILVVGIAGRGPRLRTQI